MRILYGVAGEGMGHATRSRVVIDHLSKHHDVEVVVSGRAHDYLKAQESARLGVNKIWGLSIVYEDNEVQSLRTVLSNLTGAFTGGLPKNVKAYFDLTAEFRPDVVVSDFETWSHLYGKMHGLPVVSLDNNQIVNRCMHPPEVLAGKETEFLLAKAVVKAKLPGCFHYLITSFFFPEVSKPRTTLHPPVLRPGILAAKPEAGEHLLVYQTSTSNTALPEILRGCGRECRIYGLRRDLTADLVDGPLVYRPFSEQTFIEDLRTARAVVSGGSFTLMSEAVYLHKPMLSVPVKKQFEQILNGRYLEKLGYGLTDEVITARRLGELLERLPDFERQLGRYGQDGNRETLAKLDEVLEAAVHGGPASGADPLV
ncbi:MAG TPA: MJ1255/VC2487 family glycosyltransferase [Anaeromyxobacteraceae bacterium]|nr:MJ1255/VC2487 family glycosyltransferase [Anaeromyxobacteraceae bacterium]